MASGYDRRQASHVTHMYDGEIYDGRVQCHLVTSFKCYKSPEGEGLAASLSVCERVQTCVFIWHDDQDII